MRKVIAGAFILAGTGITAMASTLAMEAGSKPDSTWQIKANKQDNVSISGKDGILTVNYDVNVNKTHQVGHKTYNQVPFRLMLKKPVPLDDRQRRVTFQASGLDDISPDHNRRLIISPIIQDENGELLIYTPNKYPHLKPGGKTWATWMTRDFFVGEAGGATQDIFEAEGGDRNAWPNGKLAFAGFQINVRKPEFGRCKGTVHIGDIKSGGIKLVPGAPFVYADSFLKKKGTYNLTAVVRNQFQGTPVREISQKINFDPANPASCRQQLEIPLGPVDNYWIDYQITDESGKIIQADFMRYQITSGPKGPALKPVDTEKSPVLGYLRINPGKPGNGVYKPNEPFIANIRVFPKGADKLELDWVLTPWSFCDKLDSGNQEIKFSDESYKDIKIKLLRTSDRDAYKLTLKVKNKGKVVDTRTFCLGYQTDMKKSHDRAGLRTDRNEIKKHAYNRTTYLSKYRRKPPTFQQELSCLREFLENAKFMADNFTYMVELADFEVLPGVFDFSMLDKVMDTAADYGCKVTVRLCHADNNGLYLWPKYTRQISYDGTEIEQHYYGAYAVSDPRIVKVWLDAYRALFDRYDKHTAFQGYYVMQPGGEWTVIDKPWMGTIAGYSEVTIEGFRKNLKENLKLSLTDLNKRWGTKYKSWDEVTSPQPTLKLGVQPDLRMCWVDFSRFKSSMGREIWYPLAINSIREYDNDRITITYSSPKDAKLLYGKLDYGHNGGNHYGHDLGQYVEGWEKGKIGWITEPHHPHNWAAYGDPAEKGWVLDWSVWVMIAQAGAGGTNLHVYYYPNPTMNLAAHYGGEKAYDRFEKYKPILEELHTFKLMEPPIQVATLQDLYTLFCKHRTTFNARKEDLKRWFDLLKKDSIATEELTPGRVENYKLLLPNILDEVMQEKNINLLDKAVRNGAKMIICANTGKYCPELGQAPFQFLKKLGITPPQGAYINNRTNVSAKVEQSNPLFSKGSKIDFFSLADYQKDLQSENIKKNFWQYPYRWIPQTNYFGYYPNTDKVNGTVLARFPEGGVALSEHKVGKGEVIVFWGTPDVRDNKLKGMMEKATIWANAVSPRRGSPIPRTIEGRSDVLKRHYALMYHETPGIYTQKLPTVPDGKWFVTELVGQQKLGLYTGRELREKGVTVTYIEGYSPLKVIRIRPVKKRSRTRWLNKYRTVSDSKK